MVRKRRLSSMIALLLLLFQVAYPIGNVFAADSGVLLPPSNLAYQATSPEDGNLVWSSVNSATGYNVYQITDGQLVLLGTTKTNSYALNNLAEGNYSYVVSTLSTTDESGPSAPVDVNIVYPTMAAPSSLTNTIQNGNDIVLTWGSSQYAQKYNVYQIAQDGTKTLLTTTPYRTYTIVNANEGKYSFAVSAVNSLYGESAVSTTLDVNLVFPVMQGPANPTFTITNGNDINLKWQAASYANSYKIFQIIDGQEVYKTSVTTTSAIFTNMQAGDYVYKVYSVSDRFGTSANGSQISLTVSPITMVPPSSVSYKFQNINDVVLTWGTSSYATAYKVYQIINDQKVLMGTYTGTTATYTNQLGGDYTYEVHSYSDRFGESETGTVVNLSVASVIMVPPNNVVSSIKNLNDIVLSWDAAPNAGSYNIYQIIDGQRVLKSTVTSTTATFTNMPAGDYTYEITAVSSRFGESATGSKVSLTLDPVIIQKPANFSYQIQNGNDISLTWESAENATNYRVYQIVNGQRVLKSTVTSNSVTFTNMPAGDYSYQVYTYNSRFGESADGSALSFSLVFPSMDPPSNAVSSITTSTAFTLSWDSSPYATSYKVYQIVNGTKTLKNTVSGTSISYNSMQPGQYLYEIHSYSSRFGESVNGSQVSVTLTGQAMGTPTNLQYSILNGNDIKLTWNSVQYATNYKIYKVIDGFKILQSTITGTSITYTNQPAGDYDFVVDSYYSLFGESPQGAETQFTLVYPSMQKPANLTGTTQNISDIVLKWDPVQYAGSYNIYELINGQEVLKNTVTTTTATFTKATEGTHTYVVHSVSSRFGESIEGSSTDVSVTFPILQAPQNLSDSLANGNDFTLNWSPATYATSYNVYQVVDGTKLLVGTTTGTSLSFSNMPEDYYSYEVHTVSNRFGESSEGSIVSFTLVFPDMQAPKNFTNTIANGNDITLSWSPVTYANSYKVYQVVDGVKTLLKTTTGTSLSLPNMPEGSYQYEVHSFSSRFGESTVGSQVMFDLVFPIMQPPNASYTIVNGNDITLKWSASTYATAYKVYQMVDGVRTLVKTTTGTSLSFTNMPEGNYQYEVYSYSDRFGESPDGSNVTFNLVFPIMQAPGSFSYSISNGNDIVLKWNASTYATAYKVYQVVDGEKTLLKTITGTSTSFTSMPEGDYSYEVHSYSDRFGESPLGSALSLHLTWPVFQQPVLQGSIFNANNVTLTWNSIAWANEYHVYELKGDTKTLIYKGTALTFKAYNLTEDIHSYEVAAFNTRFGGEYSFSNILDENIIYPNMQAPTASVKVSSPTSALISWSFATYANGYNVYELVDGIPVLLAKNVNNLSYTVSNLSYKNHEFYVTSYSNSFGESGPSNTVLAKLITDTQAPVTTANASSDWSNSGQTVTLTATDDDTGIAHTYYSLNDGPFVEGTTVTVRTEGINKLSFYSIDKAGNIETTKTVDVKIDQTAPVTNLDKVPDSFTQSYTGNLFATDFESGVDETYYSINGADYVEGTTFTIDQEGVNEVSYYSVDTAGNKEEAKTVEVKIDKTAPVTQSDAPSDWVNKDVQVNLNANDSQSGVAQTYYSINGSDYVEGTTFKVDQEGLNQITYYSVDNAGNKEEAKTIQVNIDKTAPGTQVDVPKTWVNTDVQVTLSADDNQSGVAQTYYSINGSGYEAGTTFTVGQEGINQVSYYSVDNAGNKEEAKTVEVKIDKTAPETESDAPTAWENQDAQVNLRAGDTQSGVAQTYYSINGSDYVAGTTFTVDQEGINQVSYYSVDNAGNKEEAKIVDVKVDKTAPETLSDAPTAWVNQDVQVNLIADDTQSGVGQTYYSVNGSDYVTGTSFTVGQEGINQISYYSVDNAGNKETTKTVEVKIDKTAPVITSNFNDLYELGSNLNLNYNTNDILSGVVSESVILTSPGEVIGKAVNKLNQISLDKPGVYTLTIFSTDAAGNTQILKKKFTVYIPASIEVTPNVIKGNKGVFTLRVDLPQGFATNQLDLDSAKLNGVSALNSNNGYYNQAKLGQFKFERSNFQWAVGEQALEFRCYANGYLVIGQTNIKVIN